MILTGENYYSLEANKAYWSVSQVKAFMDCQARAMAEISGEAEPRSSQALLEGGYLDAHFAGEMDAFRQAHPEILTKKGTLRAEFERAEEAVARIERDELAMQMLAGEKQKIVTGEIDGEPFKAKLDVLLSEEQAQTIGRKYPSMSDMIFSGGAIVDLKYVRDFEPLYREGEGRLNFAEYWRYDLQMAVYRELVRKERGEAHGLPCYLLCVTKQAVPALGLFRVPDELMDFRLEELRTKILPEIVPVKNGDVEPERCGGCEYCRETEKLDGARWFPEWE